MTHTPPSRLSEAIIEGSKDSEQAIGSWFDNGYPSINFFFNHTPYSIKIYEGDYLLLQLSAGNNFTTSLPYICSTKNIRVECTNASVEAYVYFQSIVIEVKHPAKGG